MLLRETLELEHKQTELSECRVDYDNLLRAIGCMNHHEADIARARLDEMAIVIQALRVEIQRRSERLISMYPESWFWF